MANVVELTVAEELEDGAVRLAGREHQVRGLTLERPVDTDRRDPPVNRLLAGVGRARVGPGGRSVRGRGHLRNLLGTGGGARGGPFLGCGTGNKAVRTARLWKKRRWRP